MRDRDENKKIRAGEELRNLLELEPKNLIFYYKDHQKSLIEGSTLKGSKSYQFIGTPVPTPIIPEIIGLENATEQEIKKVQEEDFEI